MVNRVSSYFPKGGHSASETELKIMRKVKDTETLTPKTGNRKPQQNYRLERSLMNYWGLKLVLRAQPDPQFLKWYTAFSWLFGSHNNPLTRQ